MLWTVISAHAHIRTHSHSWLWVDYVTRSDIAKGEQPNWFSADCGWVPLPRCTARYNAQYRRPYPTRLDLAASAFGGKLHFLQIERASIIKFFATLLPAPQAKERRIAGLGWAVLSCADDNGNDDDVHRCAGVRLLSLLLATSTATVYALLWQPLSGCAPRSTFTRNYHTSCACSLRPHNHTHTHTRERFQSRRTLHCLAGQSSHLFSHIATTFLSPSVSFTTHTPLPLSRSS